MQGLIRFVLIWYLSRLLAPRLNRLFAALGTRFPRGSLAADTFEALREQYSTTLLRSMGETVGELVLGPRTKGRGKA